MRLQVVALICCANIYCSEPGAPNSSFELVEEDHTNIWDREYFRKSNQEAIDVCAKKMVRTARTLGRPLKMPDGRIELRHLLVPEDRDAETIIAKQFLTMLAEGVYLKRKPRRRLSLK